MISLWFQGFSNWLVKNDVISTDVPLSEKYEIKACTETEDAVCSRCPPGFTWKTKRRGTERDGTGWEKVMRGKCRPCGACCTGPKGVDFTCLARFADAVGCSYDSQCLKGRIQLNIVYTVYSCSP